MILPLSRKRIMKNIILVLSIFIIIISCGADQSSITCKLDQTITFNYNNTINICDDMTHIKLQGIDSNNERIEKDDLSMIISYEFGVILLESIQESDPAKIIDNVVNQEL